MVYITRPKVDATNADNEEEGDTADEDEDEDDTADEAEEDDTLNRVIVKSSEPLPIRAPAGTGYIWQNEGAGVA
jgi:hypothetical protein